MKRRWNSLACYSRAGFFLSRIRRYHNPREAAMCSSARLRARNWHSLEDLIQGFWALNTFSHSVACSWVHDRQWKCQKYLHKCWCLSVACVCWFYLFLTHYAVVQKRKYPGLSPTTTPHEPPYLANCLSLSFFFSFIFFFPLSFFLPLSSLA